jgi:hypothetical protein
MLLRPAETALRCFLSFVLGGARGVGRFERQSQLPSQRVFNYFRNDIYSKLGSQYNLRPTRRGNRPKGAFDQPLTLRLIRTFIPPYKVSVIVGMNFDEVAKRIFAIAQPILVRARIYPPNL